MKPVRDWSLSDVAALPVGECDWLEIKGRRALDLSLPGVKIETVRGIMSKAISAFANSGGGQLVYGLDNPATAWAVDMGGIPLAMKKPGVREWLEDVIPTLVDPQLRRFNVYVFSEASAELPLAPDHGIVVIDIGDSEDAPHQASDNRYYGRIGGKSHPLNHRFVSDIFHRRREPSIDIALEFDIITKSEHNPITGEVIGHFVQPELAMIATNAGRVYARYVTVIIDLPP